MPVAITEMMMKGKVCIISDKVGHAQYIKDGENGFVFADGDFKNFTKKLEYVIVNANKLQDIGKNARKIYLQNFEMNVFKKNLNVLLKKNIS
jgi:glycosyltransferase involved in cell wall biosynthesis